MDALLLPPFFRTIRLSEIGSTSDEARRLAALDAEEGTLVWADAQTNGHGRGGRTWISPPGNLYFSVLLRPEGAIADALQLTFAAAVALAEVIEAILQPGAPRIGCKWPNDVLIGGHKVAGILLESQVAADGSVEVLVVGIGVNVASHPPAAAVMYPATSLHAAGADAQTPVTVLQRFCPIFLRWYRTWQQLGFPPVREAWLARAEKLHQEVDVQLESGMMTGVFAGLAGNGAMLLQQGGLRRTILAGDVFPAAAR